LHQTYPTRLDIFIGFQSLGTGSRSDISDPRQTYPMDQIYLILGQVPELWQLGPVIYILPPSDIPDSAKISRIRFGI
jgi:hypothetical protein